jgi:hypothetical protein
LDKFRAIEAQAVLFEKQEILEIENLIEIRQGTDIIRTEANSKLIGQIMLFDPNGPPRRPTVEVIQGIRKLNADYKLGQALCKSRQPDFLLALIKRQNARLALPWLSSLIESSSGDSLEIMPIQCICEYVWNLSSGSEEAELSSKKQIGLDNLLGRMKTILTTSDLNDSIIIQQIKDTFDYFLAKLCSERVSVRNATLKILGKIFIPNYSLDRIVFPPTSNVTVNPVVSQQQQHYADLAKLIGIFKKLSAFDIYIKPLLIKYFRQAIMVETNASHLNLYLKFLLRQLLIDFKQESELESRLRMEMEQAPSPASPSAVHSNANYGFLLKNNSFKTLYNEIAVDLADFFQTRDFYLNAIRLVKLANLPPRVTSKSTATIKRQLNETRRFKNYLIEFSLLLIKINQYDKDDEDFGGGGGDESENGSSHRANSINFLLKNKPKFSRANLNLNSYLLIEFDSNDTDLSLSPSTMVAKSHIYIHEKVFNLIVSFLVLVVKLERAESRYERLTDDNGLLNSSRSMAPGEAAADDDDEEMAAAAAAAHLDEEDEDEERGGGESAFYEVNTKSSYLNLMNDILVRNQFLNCEDGLDEAVDPLNKDRLLGLNIELSLVEESESMAGEAVRNENQLCFELVNSILDYVPAKIDLLNMMINK